MQSSKTRSSSSGMNQKSSPITARSTRQTKAVGPESSSLTPEHPATRTPTERSPKVSDRRSPRSPASEKKRISRMSELESQLIQAQEDLKKTKELLSSSESCKKRALQEADEVKKQYLAMVAEFENTKCQLSSSEDSMIQELRKLSQERDRAWQSELEAVQKRNTIDSAALASATNEIHKLKLHIEMVMNSEVAQAKQAELAHSELMTLRQDMVEALSLLETLKAEHKDCAMLEAEYQGMANATRMELEVAYATIRTLRFDGSKVLESFNSLCAELEAARSRTNLLEETVTKFQLDNSADKCCFTSSDPKNDDSELCAYLRSVQSEVEQLKSALEVVEIRFLEEQVKSTMQICAANELAEFIKAQSNLKEAELDLALKETNAVIFEWKATLIGKEAEFNRISDLNQKMIEEVEKERTTPCKSELESKLKNSVEEIIDLRANLEDKEVRLQSMLVENEMLKLEVQKKEAEMCKSHELASAEHNAGMVFPQDIAMGIGCITDGTDKNTSNAANVEEQLEATQVIHCEMEAELRRLRIQSEQWRKAAEAAVTILTTGNNGKLMERTRSMDPSYIHLGGKLMSLPYTDDIDEESPKKKNNNVLRKLGVFLKKGQK